MKDAVKVIADWILEVLNRLVQLQEFPSEWKIAKVILAQKKGQESKEATTYRPICLLKTMDKLYESLIRSTLEKAIEERNRTPTWFQKETFCCPSHAGSN